MEHPRQRYSFIIPYRNRQEHLEILLPTLQERLEGWDYEIIVSEQNDANPFNISGVQNVGATMATGDVLVFHQVDYIPTEDVSYVVNDVPVLPARRGIFLGADHRTLRPIEDVPAGYRGWIDEIDPRFYGGVIAMTREHFLRINGFNPMYVGWGNEDEDLRERFVWEGIPVHRNETGTFYCLYHDDNGNMANKDRETQKNFFEGRKYLIEEAKKNRHIGYSNMTADISEMAVELPNVRWVRSTNYRIVND